MEETQPLNQLRQVRLEKLQKLKNQGINSYPAVAKRDHSLAEAIKMQGRRVVVVGRLRAWRGHGKIQFGDLHDETGKIQVVFKADILSKSQFQLLELFDIGDFLAVQGEVFKTNSGEVSVLVEDFQLLTKSLRPLPSKWHGLKDVEERYRYRYLDFLFNDQVKQNIKVRAKVIASLREFLTKEGFLEVETPILETKASGAVAKPFTTHINAYGLDLYLRICMGELWQKRLMIGGFEKTFELGKAFRNEGVSKQHSPEFTLLEYYWAYADYQKNMELQERLIAYVVEETIGKRKITYQEKEIDFTPPYLRRTYQEVIQAHTGLDISAFKDKKALLKAVEKKGLKVDPKWGWAHIIDEFYKEFVRPKLLGPLFLIQLPAELKPLAKRDQNDPRYTESFQLIVAGFELSNNYSELNDPLEQAQRFLEQKKLDQAGDEETMAGDQDFVEALEYGMPPTTGAGIGVDRLVALLTDSHSIRETMAFPLMKPKT